MAERIHLRDIVKSNANRNIREENQWGALKLSEL
jgi:hypothetical protein